MNARVQELISKFYDDQRSDEWFKLRGNLLTASDAACAIGENYFKSPDELIVEKCGYRTFFGNEHTQRGIDLEPVVRDLYDQQTGTKTHEIGLLVHDEHTWLGGSVDGLTESGLLVEIKCPSKFSKTVPKYYMPQIQLLLEITKLTECDFIQYVNQEMRIIRVQKDPEWFPKYLPIMRAFWDRVLHARKNGLCEIII